jgi:glutaredoxin
MINFYSMEGCGYCKKAQAELKEEIALGKVNLKSAKEAPAGVTGFPHFTSSSGATHTGYLPKDQLLEKLGENIKEGYNNHPHKQPHHPHKQPHHPHKQPHQEPEICRKGSGGYLTLGQTWIKQKSYIA